MALSHSERRIVEQAASEVETAVTWVSGAQARKLSRTAETLRDLADGRSAPSVEGVSKED